MSTKTNKHSRKTKTPVVLQMEATECGAAALGIVLAYYGKDVGLTELRAACGVTRDGSVAGDIARAARHYGLQVQGYRRTEPGRVESTPAPFIAYWDHSHFLVVEGFSRSGDRVFLNDPARGRHTVRRPEFDQRYSGLILTLAKGPEFEPHHEKWQVLSGLRRRMRGTGLAVGLVVACGLALSLLAILGAVLVQLFVNEVLVSQTTSWIPSLIAMIGALLVVQVGAVYLQQSLLLRLSTKLSLTMATEFLWHLLRLPPRFYSQRLPGGLVSRVQINDTIAQLLAGPVASALVQLISAVIVVSFMLFYSVVLTVAAVAILIANFVILVAVSRTRTEANQKVLNERYHLNAASFATLGQIETIKSSGIEDDALARLTGPQARYINTSQSQGVITSAMGVAPGFFATINSAIILGLGALLVMNGELTIGAVLAFQMLVGYLLAPVATLVSLGGSLQDARASLTQIDDVLAAEPDPVLTAKPSSQLQQIRRLDGRVALESVTFGFSAAASPLIDELSLTIEPGSRVALVGSTGSGKSTIGKLLVGLLEPTAGKVLLDDQPLPSWPRNTVTSNVARVDQNSFLFEGSVRDNITMWDTTITDRAVLAAAADAQIDDVIERLEGAYAAIIRQGGSQFSGGQRQRIAIARALATEPAVLILDEATSALDATTELRIHDALRRRAITCVIIAHRLSTIRDCDQILVLDDGAVVAAGTHLELVADSARYRELIAD